jgi:hypothetical protein
VAGNSLKQLFEFASDYRCTLLVLTPVGFMQVEKYGIGLEDFRLRNLVLCREDHVSLLKPFGPAGRARVEAIRARLIRSSPCDF